MRRAATSGCGGFTLIEVMVAMAILGLALVTTIQLFGQALRLLRAAGEHQRAVVLADRKLREQAGTAIEEGITSGEADGYQWQQRVTRIPSPEDAEGTSPVRTFRVTLEVRWGRGQKAELETLRTLWTHGP